jgi:hypothetical protein
MLGYVLQKPPSRRIRSVYGGFYLREKVVCIIINLKAAKTLFG